jgi:hypothetical protein
VESCDCVVLNHNLRLLAIDIIIFLNRFLLSMAQSKNTGKSLLLTAGTLNDYRNHEHDTLQKDIGNITVTQPSP